MKRLVFLFDSSVAPWGVDVDAIRSTLTRLAGEGFECEIIDTERMDQEVLEGWRDEATKASVRHHQAIRQAFGSRRAGGLPFFGKQVPALLVYERGDEAPVAVYPHSETRGDTRTDFTIEGYLDDLIAALEDGQ